MRTRRSYGQAGWMEPLRNRRALDAEGGGSREPPPRLAPGGTGFDDCSVVVLLAVVPAVGAPLEILPIPAQWLLIMAVILLIRPWGLLGRED